VKELIHFAHGNGFPSLCYKQFLNYLEPRFDYCYVDKVGHNHLYPVTENWHHLITEVIESIKKQANQPVIAVGHSLGGVLSLLAAIKEPELFKAVIMLDSPLIGPLKSSMVRWAKTFGLIDRLTPALRTKGRRGYWPNYDQVLHYLRSRPLFKTFTDECLNDYIKYGLDHKEDGYYLRFNSQIEYQIYRTIPHIIPQYEGKLITPASLIYGDKSTVIDRMDRRYMKKHFNIRGFKTRGTHLFPMEHPQAVAQQVIRAVDAII
jgi:pimeloyl-ACP methyl ester carboxylesterase